MPKLSRSFIIVIGIFVLGTVTLTIVFWPFIKQLGDPVYREGFSAWVKELGIAGIAILLGLQILQIIVAMIPGGPVELIAGAAYGAFGGLVICAAGCVIASSAVFLVVRKFGLPLVVKFFGEENIKSWKFLQNSKRTARAVFIIFLIPGTPKDMLTWFAPLSGLSLKAFVGISVFARIPAILSTTIMGDSMIQGNWVMFLGIFIFIALTGFIAIGFKDRILKKISRNDSQGGNE